MLVEGVTEGGEMPSYELLAEFRFGLEADTHESRLTGEPVQGTSKSDSSILSLLLKFWRYSNVVQ